MALKDDIRALHSQGVSYNGIAAQLGCSKGTISYHLVEGSREKSAALQRDRRAPKLKFQQDTKSATPCLDCGVSYPHYVMDYDHRPTEVKLFNIGQHGKGYTWDVLKAEMAKCDIVCSNCHRRRTWERMLKTGESTGQSAVEEYFA